MIFLVHQKASKVVGVYRNSEEIPFSGSICQTFWKLAEEFSEELIIWVEKDFFQAVRKEKMEEYFDHALVMSSYAIKSKFLSDSIGYIDQMPFINVKSGVRYPTWRMSSDVGGIKGKAVLEFRELFKDISDFDYLLNSVSKLGQQNGLLCYSDPNLIAAVRKEELNPSAKNEHLLLFVYQHYKSIWFFVLFFCLMKYENVFPFGALFQAFIKKKFFKTDIDLSDIKVDEDTINDTSVYSIDVIIPTLGRAEYVRQVLEDFSMQSLIPKRVIIVEQQPKKSVSSELQVLLEKEWPFQVVHLFTHKTGACMARNMALEKIESEWIFFADDDIRIEKEVLSKTLKEAARLRVGCINLNCRQIGEETKFLKIKQWGSFGSGTSVVHSTFLKGLWFSEIFEYGYGEDADFGMKLRERGCDIIYHPELEIKHLKAPIGGFRIKATLAWEKENPKPKPSPTIMIFAKKYYTMRQMKGFKISLFLKYFKKQEISNPLLYFNKMEKSWKKSEEWAKNLFENSNNLDKA